MSDYTRKLQSSSGERFGIRLADTESGGWMMDSGHILPISWQADTNDSARYELSFAESETSQPECYYGQGYKYSRRRIDVEAKITDLYSGAIMSEKKFKGKTPQCLPHLSGVTYRSNTQYSYPSESRRTGYPSFYELLIWILESTEQHVLPLPIFVVSQFDFLDKIEVSPDKKYLALFGHLNLAIWTVSNTSQPRQARARRVYELREVDLYRKYGLHYIDSLVFSPDGNSIAFTGKGKHQYGEIVFIETRAPKELRRLRVDRADPGRFFGLSFSSDGTQILTYDVGHTAKVWDQATGKEKKALNHRWDAGVVKALFIPGRQLIVSVDNDFNGRIWCGASDYKLLREIRDVGMFPNGFIKRGSPDHGLNKEVFLFADLVRANHVCDAE